MLPQRGDGGVDAAAEGDENALAVLWRVGELQTRAGEPRERAMEGVGSEDGRVAVAGRQAAELGLDLVGPQPGCIQNRSALRQLRHSRGRGGGGGAALVVEADPLDASRGGDQRDPRQVAARRAAGGAAEGSIAARGLDARHRRGSARRSRDPRVED